MAGILKTVTAPFCAGTSNIEGATGREDGNISVTVLGACIQTVGVIFMVLMYNSSVNSGIETSYYVVWGSISATQLVGLLAIIILACHVYANRTSWGVQPGYSFRGRWLLFLWIFGLAGILQFAFIASVNIYCIESRPNYDTFKGIFSVVYHMLSISFYTMQIGFISFFHKIKFEASKLVNYSLMFILTATVLDYISAVLNDALLDHEHTNATDVRLANLTDRCYYTSPLRQFYVHLYPYIVPAKIEFSLLSCACFLKMWYSTGSNVRVRLFANSITEFEETLLLSRDRSSYQSLSEQTSVSSFSAQRIESSSSRPISLYVTLVVGALITVPMLVVVFLVLYVNPTDDQGGEIYFDTWERLRIISEVILFIVLMITFYSVSDERSDNMLPKSFDCDEGILTFCACGAVGISCFGIYSGVVPVSPVWHKTALYIVVESALAVINVYLQTVLIIHSNRVIPSIGRPGCRIRRDNLFMLLHILNFAMWILLTLSSNQLKLLTPIQQHIFGQERWTIIAHIFVPLFLFYRFQSSMDFYNLFTKFRS